MLCRLNVRTSPITHSCESFKLLENLLTKEVWKVEGDGVIKVLLDIKELSRLM